MILTYFFYYFRNYVFKYDFVFFNYLRNRVFKHDYLTHVIVVCSYLLSCYYIVCSYCHLQIDLFVDIMYKL